MSSSYRPAQGAKTADRARHRKAPSVSPSKGCPRTPAALPADSRLLITAAHPSYPRCPAVPLFRTPMTHVRSIPSTDPNSFSSRQHHPSSVAAYVVCWNGQSCRRAERAFRYSARSGFAARLDGGKGFPVLYANLTATSQHDRKSHRSALPVASHRPRASEERDQEPSGSSTAPSLRAPGAAAANC
jgi:hypothetical protein